MNSQSHPLRVDFITSEQFPQLQKIGILTVSGEIDWERDLEDGLDHLEDTYGESTLVVLDVNNALTSSQVKDLEWECLIRFPYVFCSLECAVVPSSLKKFAMCISEIVVSLINNKDDKKTIIYSVGSPSISGLTAACTIAAASEGEIDSARAIEIVRAARRDAIESGEQERFVSLFGEYWKIYHKNLRDFYQQKNASPSRFYHTAGPVTVSASTVTKRLMENGTFLMYFCRWVAELCQTPQSNTTPTKLRFGIRNCSAR